MRYSSLKNESTYKAECGHCGEITEHDTRTRRCKVCGAKNDTVSNATEKEIRDWHDLNHTGRFESCEKCKAMLKEKS